MLPPTTGLYMPHACRVVYMICDVQCLKANIASISCGPCGPSIIPTYITFTPSITTSTTSFNVIVTLVDNSMSDGHG